MVTNTIYPDSTDTDATGTDQVKTSYDRLGRSVTKTDQRGVQHTYSYDTAGRLLSDAVTVLPAGVDGAIRRIEYGYDDQSRVQTVTSYDAATAGNIVNQIAYSYDGWGNLIQSRQSHAGAVTSTTPGVAYTYADGAVNGAARYVRLVTVTYPNGRTVGYDYGTTGSADDRLSRIAALTEGSNAPVATYTYLGAGTVIASARPQATNGLTLTLGNAGNDYAGLDRFGRTVSLQWQDDTNTNVDAYGYSYDRNSNRITKSNLLNSTLDEAYTYDSLNRLTATTRGGTAYQDWSLDSLGNMNSVTTGGTTETRTHNAANELEGMGASTLVNDAAGNTTTDDHGQHLTYDAWNRLTQVRDASDTVLVIYQYDGQNRRIVADIANAVGGAQDLYYTEGWQLVEVRNSGNTAVTTQYLWGIRYTDDLILRDQDANSNGSFEAGERLYALQDANFNVTAVADSAGTVVERFVNDPYGKFVVLSSTWTAMTDAYQWQHHHQGLLYQATTSLYWNRNRDYSPSMQRFTGADPLVYVDGGNMHAVYRGDPISGSDALGLYSASDVRTELIKKHGKKLEFVLDQMDKWGHDFKVESIYSKMFDPNRFHGFRRVVLVDCGAGSISEAADWALDGLREWAWSGTGDGNYFNEITRKWSQYGEGSGDTAYNIGSVLDWLYLFSGDSSMTTGKVSMYPVASRPYGSSYDLFNIFCWVYTGASTAYQNGHARAGIGGVNIPANNGLHSDYFDTTGGVVNPIDDQSHHFAAYFEFGGHFGSSKLVLGKALTATGDYDMFSGTIYNFGDFDLGVVAADLGSWFASSPGYHGTYIANVLKTSASTIFRRHGR